MIRVLIADDHPVVREGMKQILADAADMVVSGEAVDGQDLLEKVRAKDWDVVVLDLSMPGPSGLELVKEVKRRRPGLGVLVLSMHAEDQFAVRVLKAGASGYMTKETAPDELIRALRKIAGGGRYVSPQLAETLAFKLEHDAGRPSHELLSDREYQVLCLIGSGKTVKDIAEDLSLSIKTISTYRTRILEKMKLKTTTDLIRYTIHHQLVT